MRVNKPITTDFILILYRKMLSVMQQIQSNTVENTSYIV